MAASGSIHHERRLGVLDGLRGIAVLLVLWYHVWEISFLPAPVDWLEFVPETGFVGVHLFFFLSGFVIAYPFVRAAATGAPGPGWGSFAWRRFVKIVPSYVLSIAVAYSLGYAQRQPGAATVPDLASHLLFVHTWFADRYGTINGVLWTLAVEVEFYCIFPLIWWCFKRQPWLTAALMIGIAWAWRAALASCCYTTLFPQYEENLPGYLDIFAFGMLAALAFTRYGERWRTSRWSVAAPLLSLAGAAWLVALLFDMFGYRLADQWAGVWQIDRRPLLGASFAIIALGFLSSPRWWQILLDNPPLRFLAAISYNLYLYHQMVARELLRQHVPPYVGDPHYDPPWQVRYTEIAFAATIAMAAVVTYAFERPLLRLEPPRFLISAGGALRRRWSSSPNEEAPLSKPRSP
jgi:peptidoglycan/LPS O-acetylase OafA/YrhL